eukprot:TRINITY_DN72131_c0_g1_i1.p1 TRINITY_DN72131_c0_g1~~TRINITY_DN72131_c0_g1_i1.p1  ORF type:complete len:603 (-),score=107.51 TRINITY_DN72131_c0_g1_i1:270-2078(-)
MGGGGKGKWGDGGSSMGGGGGYVHKGGKGGGGGAGYNGGSCGKGPKGGGGPRVEDSIEVDDRDMGRLIGKGGSSIRDLQDGTGCRIVTPNRKQDGEEPGMRTVKIIGPEEQVKKCKEAISGVLCGDEPKDVLAEIEGAVSMKNVDPICMGHLAKVKSDLEQKHSIVLELDARSARIWSNDGNRESALAAKEHIEDALEDLIQVDTVTVPVPSHLVNQAINDSALRQLQDQTGLTANVSKTDEGTGIRLTGLAGAIAEAKLIIEKRAAGEGAEFLALTPGLFSRMPPHQWNDLQRDVGFLMQNSGAEVEIMQGSNRANFRGSSEAVSYAKSEMMKILHFYFPQECDAIELPPETVDWIAGEDDRELMRLQTAGAVAALDRAMATMWICGNPRSVEQVRNRVRNSLARWDREHVVIRVHSKGQCFAVIGTGGSTIRELQKDTGARIDVNPDSLTITISGREENVVQAKSRVKQITERSGDWSDKGSKGGGDKGGWGDGGGKGGWHGGDAGEKGGGGGWGRGGGRGGGGRGAGRGRGAGSWEGNDCDGGGSWGGGRGGGQDAYAPDNSASGGPDGFAERDAAAEAAPVAAPSRPASGRGRGASRW